MLIGSGDGVRHQFSSLGVQAVKAVESEFDQSVEYKQYIGSESWRARRRQYFAKFGRDCKGCGEQLSRIHVHHKTYERFGNEDLNDLVSVCEACHAMIHQRHQLGGVTLEQATTLVLSRIREHKKIILDERLANKEQISRIPQLGPNTKSRKYQRKFAVAAAISASGVRRSSIPPDSWTATNEEYVKLRQREEARRRTT